MVAVVAGRSTPSAGMVVRQADLLPICRHIVFAHEGSRDRRVHLRDDARCRSTAAFGRPLSPTQCRQTPGHEALSIYHKRFSEQLDTADAATVLAARRR